MKKLLIILTALLLATTSLAQNRRTVPRLQTTLEFRTPVKTDCSKLTNQRKGDLCFDSDFDIATATAGTNGSLFWYDGTNWHRVGRAIGGTTVPSSCQSGDYFIDTDDTTTGGGFYFCKVSTYEQVVGSGGGGATTLGGLSDTSLSSPASGEVLLYDGTNSWDNKALSGDVTITSEGATTIGANTVALTTDTTGNYVSSATASQGLLLTGTEGASLGFIDCAANEIMKRNAGDTAWACGSDSTGSGGSPVIFDIGDDGGNDSTDVTEFATSGDTNSAFTMPLADKILVDLAQNWPSADTADALSADPANCAANSFAAGITAAGVAEGCVDLLTEAELSDESELEAQITDMANIIQETEIDSFAELDAITGNLVADNVSNTWSTGLQVIDGDTDEIQLRVQGHSTQTADLFTVEKSDGTDLLSVSNAGLVTLTSTSGSTISAATGNDLDIIAAASQTINLGDGAGNEVRVSQAGEMTFAGTGAFTPPNGASPPATCTFGEFFLDTDETDDTVLTTATDNTLALCTSADTWTIYVAGP
jgi:hypothetical protein